MKKKIAIITAILLVCSVSVVFFIKERKYESKTVDAKKISKKAILDLRPDVGYVKTDAVSNIQSLNLLGRVQGKFAVESDIGKISRAYRYRDIVKAVTDRFCDEVPFEYVLAIFSYESGGGELLCNSSDDGGIGGMHMQGATARRLGLHTYDECGAIICNGIDSLSCCRVDTVNHKTTEVFDYENIETLDYTGYDPSDYIVVDSSSFTMDTVKKNHGKELRDLYEANKNDPEKLCEYDERFNLLMNVDAAVRLILYYKPETTPEGFYSTLEYAIYRYSGNKPDYYGRINALANYISDPNYINKIRDAFNKANRNLTINGQRTDFDAFMEFCDKDNNKYGLEKYKKLEKIAIKKTN